MFAGTFRPSSISKLLANFPRTDQDIAAAVKWSIEKATGLRASFRGDGLWVEAADECLPSLERIAARISTGMNTLWHRFERAPGITHRDRSLFLRGIWDGMMADGRAVGEPLPARRVESVRKGRKRNALAAAPGVGVHPYSVALELGAQLRFDAPITNIVEKLEEAIAPKTLSAATET